MASFPLNSWVWVKQPDYPWWPAMVLDPAQSGQEIPDGSDVVLLCGPTAAATLAFANSADAEQIRPFRGTAEDAALIEESRSDESCAAAVAEMVAAAAQAGEAEASAPGATAAAGGGEHSGHGDADADDDWVAQLDEAEAAMAAAEADTAREKKHRKDKKQNSRKEKAASSLSKPKRKEERKKSRRRHRDDEAAEAAASSDDESEREESEADSGDDEDAFQPRRGAPTSRAAAAKKSKHERQSRLEEYDLGPATMHDYSPRNDPDYLYRKARNARRTATTEELTGCAAELRAVAGRCLGGAASPAEVEEDLLRVLRQLTSVDVTVDQLQASGVGVAVGGLLRNFTTAVVQLANAILTFWFHSLPQNTQQQLAVSTEVDEASVDTVASGSKERVGDLGRLGVALYGFFTNEEINDAPDTADVVDICTRLEDALEKHCDADAQMLVLATFGDEGSNGRHLRRLILEGRITADDVVKHADELPTLIRSNQRRPPNILTHTSHSALSLGMGGVGSPTSPNEVFSPSADGATGSPTFGSPTGRTTTALYTCPNCGANEAYHSSYTVQAHDNMPDILLCKKCGQSWNVADQ